MTRRAARSLALLVTVALAVLGGPPAAAGESSRSNVKLDQAAFRFVKAFSDGDEDAMRAVAEDRSYDARSLADRMLALYEYAWTRSSPRQKVIMDAIGAYAERARSRPEVRGLPQVVAAWALLAPKDLARNQWLRGIVDQVHQAEDRTEPAKVLEILATAKSALAVQPPTLSVLVLRESEARALRSTGRLDEAVAACGRAKDVAEALRSPRDEAYCLELLGLVQARANRTAEAAAAYEEALAIREDFGPPRNATWVRVELCRAWSELGRLADALAVGERALSDQRDLGDPDLLGRNLFVLACARRDLFDPAGARDLYERAAAAYRTAKDDLASATALSGSACMRLTNPARDLDGAKERYEQVLATAKAHDDAYLALLATYGLGSTARDRGDTREAVELHERALAMATDQQKQDIAMYVLAALGSDHLVRGEPKAAVDALERAIRIADEMHFPQRRLGITHRLLARAYHESGRPHDAVVAAEAGLVLRRDRARELGEGFSATEQAGVRATADTGILAALRWVAREPRARADAAAAAFLLSEAARAEFLADRLIDAGDPIETREERAEQESARRRLDDARRSVLLLAFGEARDDAALAAAKKAYEEAGARLRELRARADLRRDTARGGADPVSLEEAQRALPEGTALVLYQVTYERLVAVVVTRGGADLVDLGEPAPVIEASKRWLDAIASPDGEEGDLPETLYDALVGPLASRLTDARTLLVGRDGPLEYLPFEALVHREDGRPRRAVERWTISYVPSATVYATLESRADSAPPRDSLVALGDPVYPGETGRPDAERSVARTRGLASLDRLFASGDEVRAVAARFAPARRTVLLREDATRARLADAVRADGNRLRVLHLACHGFVDERIPYGSGLVLSGADVLSVDDVSRMRLSADVVVLSACESGRGRARVGEGILGLPRAFLTAGATRVVAADRAIADEDARDLLSRFYDAYLDGGLAPAAALRAAKLQRIRAGGPAAHPYAWAGLVLWE